MTEMLSRRDLLRRGIALAGGLLASRAFVLQPSAAPGEAQLSARLTATPIQLRDAFFQFEVELFVTNHSTAVTTIEGSDVMLLVRAPQDPNAAPVAVQMYDAARRSRAMPSRFVDLLPKSEQRVKRYDALIAADLEQVPGWSGELLRGDATVSVGLDAQSLVLTCPALELQFPEV